MTPRPNSLTRNLEDFAGIASDWFWETDADHRFTYFSERMEEVTKIRIDTILGRRRDQMKTVGHEGSCIHSHIEDLANNRPFRNFEYKLKRELDDGFLWLRVSGDPVFDENGIFSGYRGTGHDITPEKDSIARLATANETLAARNRELDVLRRDLELAAFEDPLTGLRNRRAFDLAIADSLAQSEASIALLHIDLDRFKRVNDTMGHPVGDMVLVTAASRLNALCDTRSEVFRIGGDEFALIVAGCIRGERAVTLGHAIVENIAKPILVGENTIGIGASVGVALSGAIPTSPHRLIARSDAALYAAKNEGRSCVHIAAA